MEQMTITAKVQIVATDTDKVLLDETMSVYRDACNYVSDYVFQTHDLKQFSLNKVLYSTLREKFGLKSQMAQSVLKTVIEKSFQKNLLKLYTPLLLWDEALFLFWILCVTGEPLFLIAWILHLLAIQNNILRYYSSIFIFSK